jgi:hypothetical protein
MYVIKADEFLAWRMNFFAVKMYVNLFYVIIADIFSKVDKMDFRCCNYTCKYVVCNQNF